MNIKDNILVLIFITTVVITNAAPRVYLQNDYKEKVLYKLNSQEYPIMSNSRIPLGDAQNIMTLMIKSTTLGSSYKNISQLVTHIKNQSSMYPNHNAIIVILNTKNIFEWKFKIEWEKTVQQAIERTIAFFRLAENASALYQYLTVNNILGGDYGNKIRTICSQNYALAENNGLINLCKNILTQMQSIQDAIKNNQGNVDLQQRILSLFLTTIDNSFDQLQRYRNLRLVP